MTVFQVGDKVLVKKGRSTASAILDGQICTISEVFTSYCGIEERDGGVWNDELTHINEMKQKSKYQIGETVTCVSGGEKGFGWELGRTFIIDKITFDDNDRRVVYWGAPAGGVFESSVKGEPKVVEEKESMLGLTKKWGKLGKLLLRAVELIKKLLAMLLSKKTTEKQKQEVKEAVKQFFEDVKKELSEEMNKQEQEKKSGEGDEAPEEKSDGGEEKEGDADGKDGGNGSKPSADGNAGGDGRADKAGEKNEGKDGDKNGIAKGKTAFEKLAEEVERIDADGKKKKGDAKEEEIKAKLAKARKGDQVIKVKVEAKEVEQGEEEAPAPAGNQATADGGQGASANEPSPGKVFCGVCNRYHTKGTHD